MKRMLMLMLGVFFVSVSVYANEISGEQAKKAVSFWVNSITNGASLISSRDVESVETATNETRNLFHLVKMKGGGTIITSADSRISPILAYSRNESLNVTNDNPLLKIVRNDMENRLSVIEKTESQPGMRMLSFSVTSRANNNATTSSDSEVLKSISESQNAWATFLNEPSTTSSNRAKTLLSAAPNPGQGSGGIIPFYEDIKVLPLIKTTWNQSDKNSYSKYTPNNYPCGCVATAYAQLLRYHSYPVSRNFESVQLLCSVDGVSETLSTIGGVYEWDKMPYDVDGITEEQGSAIGKLCYDIGVLQGASFESDGTGMLMTSDLLTNYFGYANTRAAYGTFEGERLMSVISGNLDAGYPVMLSFRESSENIPGHCAIADGYGVLLTSAGSVTLTHLNMGWGGNDDNWYCLPTVLSYNIVDGILYNIFPEGAEDAIVNGRVLDSNGEPILCASVKISYQGKTHDVQVDSTGSWVKRVPSGVLISVVATYGENSVSKSISVDSSLGVSNNDIAFSNVTYTRRTLYVDALSGSDTNNGMSWSSAFKSLSCAVDEAQTGDMVIVAPGTYTAINSKGKAIEIRSVDGPENTIITGEGVQRGAILGVKNGDVKTVLNGFTICDGISPNGPSAYRYNGGGVLFGTLKNCIVKNCEALECGGGVYGSILENCHVVSNSAKYGGGVADSIIRKCRISSNNATVSGGAGFWTDDCCFRLENSCYAGNYVLIGNSVIYDNTSKDGITVCGTERYYVSPKDFKICTIPQVVNCTISGIVKLMSICNSVAKIDENLTYGSWFAVGYNMLYDENMFKDASKGDFRISSEGFKLVNAGNTARAKEMPGADDFLGNNRFIGAAVDIGAIEYQSEKDWHVEYIMDGVSLSYCGRNTNIIFPSEFDGLPVRKVGINNDAARECVRSVIIPNGVKEISPDAFSGSQIQNIKIPDSVTSIGDYAFYRCSGLTSVTIPNGVTSIGEHAFAYCSGLTSITIPNSITSIGEDVFLGCDSLTSTSVPEYVLDKGVRIIFGIKKHIGFLPDIAITHVVINDGVTNIGNEAFYGCDSLISITIPNSVTNIGVRAFYSCDSLTSVTIPNSVTSIGFASFADCSGLTSVTIPDSVSSIGALAFNGCTSLESVHITDIKNWIAINFGDVKSNPLNINEKKANLYLNGQLFVFEELILPDTVTRIGDYAFYDCDWLTSVTIPDSVTSIGNSAFYRCSGLTSVTIPNGVTSIGEHAFAYCSGLTSITIPNSVTNIGYDAFYACYNIKAVTVGQYICSNGLDVFSSYKSITEVVILDGVTSIGSGAFQNCSGLTSVTIPDSVTSIGGSAFRDCSGLTSVIIPDSVTSIGDDAFSGCSSLTQFIVDSNNPNYKSVNGLLLSKDGKILIAGVNGDVVIPDSVTSIGNYAFDGCRGLTSVTIPDSVTSIGEYAFSRCELLESVTIADIKYLAHYSFSSCDRLADVTISDGVEIIFDGAFDSCDSLTNITLASSVKDIREGTFNNCHSLRSIVFLGDCPSTPVNIFSDVSSECTAYIKHNAGFDVTSSGRWHGIKVEYLKRNIMFDSAGGIVDETKRIVEAGLKMGDLPVPQRDGYIFRGWFDAPEGGNLIASETLIDDDLIVYAHWDLPFKYSENNGGATITGYIGTNSNVNIPASIEGFPVTSIGDEAFSYVSSIVSVSIPESVTNIGVNAFLGCQSLESVTLSQYALDNFSSIFADLLSSIKSIVLKEGVTSISDNAFSGYRVSSEFLENITIPQSVTNISRNAFTKHRSLKNVTISQYVCTNRLSEVFSQGYSSITNVVILDGTTSIGDSTFSGCRSLMNVVVPESVTNIGARAFNNCYSLAGVTIPYGMPYIGEYTFAGCASLKEITIPNSVTSIGGHAFYDCPSVTSIDIPNGVTNIGEYAFAGRRIFSDRSSLRSITVPPSIITIGSSAFYECEALSEVHIKDVNAWARIDFADAMANPLYYAHRIFVEGVELTEFTTSANVKDVKDYVFYNCLSLTDVIIGSGVTNIGKGAFYNALSITNLVFMGDAPNAESSAFSVKTAFVLPKSNGWDVEIPGLWNGIKLEYLPYRWRYSDNDDGTVTIIGIFPEPKGKLVVPFELDGKTVSSIGKDVFREYVHLTEIEIPENIKHIGEFAFCGCANLENIFFKGPAPTVGMNAFIGISNTCMVIPSSVASGWNCEIWNGLNVYQPLRIVDTSFEGGIGQPINVKLTVVGGRAPYTWKLSDKGQDLPYDMQNDEASTFDVNVGVAQNWKADDSCWSYDLPFQFSFCGKSYSKVFVSSNGTIAFDGALNDSVPSLDILKEHPAIAVMWCTNMTTDVGSGDVFIVENSTSVTFRWRVGVSLGGRGGYSIRNFSATLYVDGSIRLSYNAAAGAFEGIVAISPGYDAIVQVASLRNSSSYPRIANDIIFTPNITLLADGVLMGVFAPEEGKCSVSVTDALGKSADAVLAVSAIPVWLYRNVGDNEISITGRMPAPSGSVNIPSMVNGKTVVEIGREAFSNCKDMTSVIIPDGVGSIRDGAFKGCESLVNVEIPNSVTNMGSEVFEGCLNSLFDHESVKGASLVDGWCVGTTALRDEIELSGVRGIASSAFVGNQKISHVTVPVGLVNIATNAFDGCINLKSVWLPIEMKSFVEDNNLFSNVHTDFNIEYYSNGILPVAYTMIFDIGSQGEWIGGGDLKQKVIASRSAIPPEVAAPNGWQFIGWIPDVSLPAISNTVFEAQYVPEMFTTRTIGVSDWDRSSKYTVEVGDKFRFNYDLSLDYYWSSHYCADNGDELELVVIDKYWNIVKILTGDYVPNAGCADWVIDVVPGTYKVGWWLPEWDWMEPDCFFEMAVEEKTFPVLNNTASSEEVKKALSSAKDSALTNITDISTYYTFIGWANGVRNSWGTVGPQAVKFSPYAWLSFALNVDNIIDHKILSSDMVISSFRSKSETGNFDLEVSLDLKGRRIGTGSIDEATMKENLRKVFEVEGVSSIMRSNGTEENGFSAENVKISVAEPSDGKVKLTVTPKVVGDERPNSFFFRVKMK